MLLVIRGCVAAETIAVAIRTAMDIQYTAKNGTDVNRGITVRTDTHTHTHTHTTHTRTHAHTHTHTPHTHTQHTHTHTHAHTHTHTHTHTDRNRPHPERRVRLPTDLHGTSSHLYNTKPALTLTTNTK